MNRNMMEEIKSRRFRIKEKISNSIYEVECGKKRKKTSFVQSCKLFTYSYICS